MHGFMRGGSEYSLAGMRVITSLTIEGIVSGLFNITIGGHNFGNHLVLDITAGSGGSESPIFDPESGQVIGVLSEAEMNEVLTPQSISLEPYACWAHARRKFRPEALRDARSTDPNRAHRMLAWIRQLYDIERDAKKLDAESRRALREEKSKPILDAIPKWFDEQRPKVLPKSPIGEAMNYAKNNWSALTRYLDDGILDIDNNQAERALRGIAVGRKNWLFLGSDRGGRAAAAGKIYSST